MQIHTVTGATFRDYVALLAETVAESAELVIVSQCPALSAGSTMLTTGVVSFGPTVELRVYVGPPKQLELDSATRAAIDATP